jgi:hypothetical protein
MLTATWCDSGHELKVRSVSILPTDPPRHVCLVLEGLAKGLELIVRESELKDLFYHTFSYDPNSPTFRDKDLTEQIANIALERATRRKRLEEVRARRQAASVKKSPRAVSTKSSDPTTEMAKKLSKLDPEVLRSLLAKIGK